MIRFKTLATRLVLTLGLLAFSNSAMAQQGGNNGNNNDNHGNGNNNDNHGNGNNNDNHGNGNGNNGNNGNNGHTIPEIDPSSIGGGLAVLGFAATMLVDRRRRKT